MERQSKSRNRKTKCTFGGQSSGSENRSPAEAKKLKAIKKIYLKVKAPKSETESETKYMDSKDLPPPIRNKPVSGTFGGQRSGSENRSPDEAKKFKIIKNIYLEVKATKSETESETKYMDSKDLPPPISNKPVSGTFGGQRSGSENRSPDEAKKFKIIKNIYLEVKAPKSETESETKYMDSKDLPPPISNKPVSGTFGGQRSGSENRSPDEAKKFKAFYSKVKAPMSETESETKYMDSKDLPPPISNKPVSGTFGGQRSGSENRSPDEAKKFKAFYSKVKAPKSETESETKYMDSKDLPPPISNKPVSGTFGGQRSGSENRSPDEAKKFKAFYSKVKAPMSETESETKYMDSKDLPPPISNKPVSGTFGGQRSGSENRSPDEAKKFKAFYSKVKAPMSETESETKYMDSKDLPPPISNKPVSGTFGGQRSGSENRSPAEAKKLKAIKKIYLKVKAPKSETESETKYMDSKDLPPPISNKPVSGTFGGQRSGSENRSPDEAKKFKIIKNIYLEVKATKSETESETKYMDSKDLPPPISNKPVSGTFGGQRSGSENRSPDEAKKFKAFYSKVKAPMSETESETKYMDSKDLPPPISNKPVSGTFGGQRSGSENRSPDEAKKFKAFYSKVKAPKSETESETKYMDSKDLPPPISNKPVSGTFGGQRSGSENRSPDEAKKFKAFYSKVKAPMSETESETKYMDSKDLPPPISNKPVSGTFGGQRSGSENRSPDEAKKFKAFYSKVKAPMSETESETKYMDSKDLPPPISNKPVSGTFGGQRSGSENRSPDEAKKLKAFYSKVKAPMSETESETKYMDSKDLPPPISNKPVSGTFGGQRSGSENRSPDEAKKFKAFYSKVKAPMSETESETKYMDSKDLPPPISNKPVSGTFGGQRSGSENRSPDEAKKLKAFYSKVKAPMSETESETKYMDSKDLPPPIRNKPVSGTFGGQRSGSENRSPDEAKKFKAFYSKVKAPMSETESETKYMDSKDLPPPIRNKPVSGTFGGQRSGSENRSPDEAKIIKAFYLKVKAPKSETESETKYMDSKDLPPPIRNKPVSGTFGGQRSGSENRSPDEAKKFKAFYLKVKAPMSETESETKYMDSKDLPPPISNKPVSGTFGGQRSRSENRSPDEAKKFKAFYSKVKAPMSETESETKYMDSKDLPPPISNKPVSDTFGGQRSGSENRSPDEAKKFKAFYSKVKAPMSETESETKYMDSKDLPPPISNKPFSGTFGCQRSGSENRSRDEAKKFKAIKTIYSKVKAPKSETESETKYMDSKDLPPPIRNKPVSGTFGSQRSGSENRSPDEAQKFKAIKKIYLKLKAPKSETESETEYMDSKDLPPPIRNKPVSAFKLKRVSGTFGGQRSGSENRSRDEAKKFKAIKTIYSKVKAPKSETESETEYMDSEDLPPPVTPPSSPDPDRPRVCTFLRKGPLVDKPLYGEKNPRIISKNGRMLKTPEFDIPLPCKPAIPVNETPRKFTKKKSKQSSSKPTAAKKK